MSFQIASDSVSPTIQRHGRDSEKGSTHGGGREAGEIWVRTSSYLRVGYGGSSQAGAKVAVF